MINGNSVIFQMGKEATFGTVPTMTQQIKISSESIKPTYNKIDEGVATGGRGKGLKATMSIKTEGSFSVLARPNDLGFLLLLALGDEATPTLVTSSEGAYDHVFTAIGTELTDSLPSCGIVVDRKAGVFGYGGVKVNSISLSAAQEDYLKCDVEVVGRTEASGTKATLTPSTLRAFRFKHGKVYIGGSEVADITSVKIDIKNNLDSSVQTTGTGDYFVEPECGTREIDIALEMIYSATAETIRNSYYKTDNTASMKVEFISDDVIETGYPYKLTIEVAAMQASEGSANMGGLETIKQSMTFNAVDNLSDELITVTLRNAESIAY